jgi:hypothetical protein
MKGVSMPPTDTLATVQFKAVQDAAGVWTLSMMISSRSYDDATARRCSLITRVRLVDLPAASGGYQTSIRKITDRDGINVARLWMNEQGDRFVGFVGYKEQTVFLKQPAVGATTWQSVSGIYDERCAADPACDKYRYQTVPVGGSGSSPVERLAAFNYLASPLIFRKT